MGNKQNKKAPQKKNTSQRNSDSRRDNWLLGVNMYSYLELLQIEGEQEK